NSVLLKSCPVLPNIYVGGNPLEPNTSTIGGDGYRSSSLVQLNCPIVAFSSVYFGNNNDGYSYIQANYKNCPAFPVISQGSNNDGYSQIPLIQHACGLDPAYIGGSPTSAGG